MRFSDTFKNLHRHLGNLPVFKMVSKGPTHVSKHVPKNFNKQIRRKNAVASKVLLSWYQLDTNLGPIWYQRGTMGRLMALNCTPKLLERFGFFGRSGLVLPTEADLGPGPALEVDLGPG